MAKTSWDRLLDPYKCNTFGDLSVSELNYSKKISIDSDLQACGICGEIISYVGEFIPLNDDPKWRNCEASIPQ